MRAVVTGPTSFIGKAVIKELVKQGIQVFAVARPDSSGREELERTRGVTPVFKNLREIGTLLWCRELSDGADLWLHLGWEGAGSRNREKKELQEKNIGYALESLQTASLLGCRRFLFAGSQAEYGICRGLMREDMDCKPVSEYGKDKLLICRQALEEAPRLGISYLHARIFSVYGPGDHPWSLISTCADAFLEGTHIELGPCSQLWNFLYIKDAASALTKLLVGKAPSGVYNVAGEDTRPLREYIKEMHQLCGERGTYEFGLRPPNAEGQVSLEPDLEKLKKETGFSQQVSFEEGIKELIAWKRKQKKNKIMT